MAVMPRVLIPLPDRDFDPTEVAVPYRVMKASGIDVVFATPLGREAHADELMLTGAGLDCWGQLWGLRKIRVVGRLLRANRDARSAYAAMRLDAAFTTPLPYAALEAGDFDALLLAGGHRARGMRAFLESPLLQGLVADFFDSGRPVAAICHGVVLAARSTSRITGRSVLYGRKTTALTWALERSAWNLTRYFARFWDPDYYRTYTEEKGEPEGARSVEAEVTRTLRRKEDFVDVAARAPDHFRKTSGMFRDSPSDFRPAHVVKDGVYVSARWPGDAFAFARTFAEVVLAARTAR